MYIRRSTRTYKGKSYTNYLLVESVQTAKGPRQKTICSLGDLKPRPHKEWLAVARKLENALAGQDDLLRPGDPVLDRFVDKARARQADRARPVPPFAASAPPPPPPAVVGDTPPPPSERSGDPPSGAPAADGGEYIAVDPRRVTTEHHREAGPVHVGYQFWKRLGMGDILTKLGMPSANQQLACAMILNRLIQPASEHAMPQWIRRTALADILGTNFDGLSEDPLYRVLDKLHPHRAAIEAALVERERSLFNLDRTIYLYDLTSTYFEGLAAANPKAQRGYSRDHRPDCKQVVIGLVVNRDGFPIAHEVFTGNTQDRTTLATMLDLLKARVGLREGSTVVVDRGICRKHRRDQSPQAALPGRQPPARTHPVARRFHRPRGLHRGPAPTLAAQPGAAKDPHRGQDPPRRGPDPRPLPQRATHRQRPRHPHQTGRPAARRSRKARSACRRRQAQTHRKNRRGDRPAQRTLPPRGPLLRACRRPRQRPVQRHPQGGQTRRRRAARRLLPAQDRPG